MLADAIQEHHAVMDKNADQINDQISEERKQCDSVRAEINAEKQRIENLRSKVNGTKVIKLNVGGQPMMVSLKTLTSDENSKLCKMFLDLDSLEVLPDGSYFIDRNAVYFFKVVDFLRNGGLIAESEIRDCKEMFRLELNFWGLTCAAM